MLDVKVCLECKAGLRGRADKKFCSDQCRNSYNYNRNRDANNFVRNVNNILRKNRRLLAELNTSGKAKVKKERLVEEGFNFNYYTNTYTTKQGSTYFFCYDHGYLAIDHDYYMLVIRQEYVR